MEDKEKTFRQILSENHERIFRICAYHSSSLDDCNDLFQQVSVNIWQSLKFFRGESKISTWIYRIALNTAIDFHRAEGRRLKLKTKFHLEYINTQPEEDLWEKIRKEKMLEELKLQINQLSVLEKLIMSLVLEEVGSKEIADVVGISEGNVRVKIHRIKENLKLKMEGQNNE